MCLEGGAVKPRSCTAEKQSVSRHWDVFKRLGYVSEDATIVFV